MFYMSEVLNSHLRRMEPSESYYSSLKLNRARTARIDAETLATAAKQRPKLVARLSSKSFSNMGDLIDMMHNNNSNKIGSNQINPSNALALLTTSTSTRLKEKSSNVLNILNNDNNQQNSSSSANVRKKSSNFIYGYNFSKAVVTKENGNREQPPPVDVNDNNVGASSSDNHRHSYMGANFLSGIIEGRGKGGGADDSRTRILRLKSSKNNGASSGARAHTAAGIQLGAVSSLALATTLAAASTGIESEASHQRLKILNAKIRLERTSRSLSAKKPESNLPTLAVPNGTATSTNSSRKQSATGALFTSFSNLKNHFHSK
jgi:hypothetical protein